MIKKEDFIKQYLERLIHKINQELEEKLPQEDTLENLLNQANGIVREIAK